MYTVETHWNSTMFMTGLIVSAIWGVNWHNTSPLKKYFFLNPKYIDVFATMTSKNMHRCCLYICVHYNITWKLNFISQLVEKQSLNFALDLAVYGTDAVLLEVIFAVNNDLSWNTPFIIQRPPNTKKYGGKSGV